MTITIVHRNRPPAQAQPAEPVAQAAPPSLGVVSVDGAVIPHEAILREAQHHASATPDAALAQAARALVVRALLLQEAARFGIEAVPVVEADGRTETAEDAQIRGLIEQEVRTPTADAAACQRYFAQNRQRFRAPDLFEVAHILLPAAPEDAAARAEARTLAKELITALRADPAAFASMAGSISHCPSRQVGGSLGQIGPGQTVPEFERALPEIAPGTVHPAPIETRYGLHVVRVDRRIEGRDLPFAQVQGQIATYLNEASRHQALRQYMTLLAGRAQITGVSLNAATTPLVQ